MTPATMAQSDKPAAASPTAAATTATAGLNARWHRPGALPHPLDAAHAHDANRTGNYSVLRDLAAPDFQAKNTAADLALGFTDLRRRNFDRFSVALAAPQLSTPPYLDPNKMLRPTGFFPTCPLQINFDLTFQNVGNQRRIFGISVATPQVPAETSAAPTVPAAKKSATQKN